MTLNSDQLHRKRENLTALRAKLAVLQQEFNRTTTANGEHTIGSRARAAHQTILAEIADVMSAIKQCEQDIGGAAQPGA